MKTSDQQPSFLYLQLGQEIIYLLLAMALAAALIMALLFGRVAKTPPIITLSEADGYSFPSGSAELDVDFRNLLAEEIVERLRTDSQKYHATIVEIVGHTDEAPVRVPQQLGGAGASNLDALLLSYLDGGEGELHAIDNAGLGLARAAAVARELRGYTQLDQLTIVPLSAAQAIDVDDQAASAGGVLDDATRRRIEIRLRRTAPRG